jgi:sugar (pentulose or hexulose) kinase
MRRFILSVDIGTSSLKAAFIDSAADAAVPRLAAFVREPYHVLPSHGGAERARPPKLPCAEWEDALRRAAAALIAAQPDARVEAVTVSGNGPTLIPVQEDGSALLPLHWFGNTARMPPTRSLFLPHVLWFKEHSPQLYAKTALFFSCQEWLAYRLGARPVTALASPDYEPFYWSAEECGAFGIDATRFPPFTALASVIGHLSAAAAAALGLSPGIPIVSGGPDFIMALLGSGAVSPGIVCDRAGSSEGINVCITREEKDALQEKVRKGSAPPPIRLLPHAIEGLWNASVVLPESGSIFERWREENGRKTDSYDALLNELIAYPERGEAHPVLLKIASQVKTACDTLEAFGLPVREMRISGGQAKNDLWNTLKAYICGRALLAPEILDAELAGNAAAAMSALGIVPRLSDAAARLARINRRYDGARILAF